MCVCIDHRLLLCTSFSRYGKETTKYYTTLADLDIHFHYPNHGCLLIFFHQIGKKMRFPGNYISFF